MSRDACAACGGAWASGAGAGAGAGVGKPAAAAPAPGPGCGGMARAEEGSAPALAMRRGALEAWCDGMCLMP